MKVLFMFVLNMLFIHQALALKLDTIPSSAVFNSPNHDWYINKKIIAGDYVICGLASGPELYSAKGDLLYQFENRVNGMNLGGGYINFIPVNNGIESTAPPISGAFLISFRGSEYCSTQIITLPDSDSVRVVIRPNRTKQYINISIPDGTADILAPGRDLYINIPYKVKIYSAAPGTNLPGSLIDEQYISQYLSEALIVKPWSGIELLSLPTMDCTDAEIGGTSQCGTIEIAPVNKPKWAELQASVVTPAGCSVDIQKGGTALGNGLYDFTADIRQAVADGKNIIFEPSVTCTKPGKHVSTIQLDFTYP